MAFAKRTFSIGRSTVVLVPKGIERLKSLRLSLLGSHTDGLIGVGRNRLYPGLYPGLAGYESLNWWILARSGRYRLGLYIGVLLKARFNAATKRIFERPVR
jgi:hypothetical protein